MGSLKNKLNEWRRITHNQYVLDIAEKVYKIPFKTKPEQFYINSNKSLLKNKDLLLLKLKNLLNTWCIKEVSTKPLIVNSLTVALNKSNKPRLVLDCRHINPNLDKYRFKYEDGKISRERFDVVDFISSSDLNLRTIILTFSQNINNIFLKRKHDILYSLFSILVFLQQVIFVQRIWEMLSNISGLKTKESLCFRRLSSGRNIYDTAVKSSKQVNDQL